MADITVGIGKDFGGINAGINGIANPGDSVLVSKKDAFGTQAYPEDVIIPAGGQCDVRAVEPVMIYGEMPEPRNTAGVSRVKGFRIELDATQGWTNFSGGTFIFQNNVVNLNATAYAGGQWSSAGTSYIINSVFHGVRPNTQMMFSQAGVMNIFHSAYVGNVTGEIITTHANGTTNIKNSIFLAPGGIDVMDQLGTNTMDNNIVSKAWSGATNETVASDLADSGCVSYTRPTAGFMGDFRVEKNDERTGAQITDATLTSFDATILSTDIDERSRTVATPAIGPSEGLLLPADDDVVTTAGGNLYLADINALLAGNFQGIGQADEGKATIPAAGHTWNGAPDYGKFGALTEATRIAAIANNVLTTNGNYGDPGDPTIPLWIDLALSLANYNSQWGVGGVSRTGTKRDTDAGVSNVRAGIQYYSNSVLLIGELSVAGSPPSTPTIAVSDNKDGTGGAVTISGADAGSDNTAKILDISRQTWHTLRTQTAVADTDLTDPIDLQGSPADVAYSSDGYWAVVESALGGFTVTGMPVFFYLTFSTDTPVKKYYYGGIYSRHLARLTVRHSYVPPQITDGEEDFFEELIEISGLLTPKSVLLNQSSRGMFADVDATFRTKYNLESPYGQATINSRKYTITAIQEHEGATETIYEWGLVNAE